MTEEEATEQADHASAELRSTILQLTDDGLDPQCIIEALIVQAVGLAFAEYGRGEGQYLVEGTECVLQGSCDDGPPSRADTLTRGDSVFVVLLNKKQAGEKIELGKLPRRIGPRLFLRLKHRAAGGTPTALLAVSSRRPLVGGQDTGARSTNRFSTPGSSD